MKCPFCESLEIDNPQDIPTKDMDFHMVVIVNFDKHMEIHAPIDNPEIMRLIVQGIGSVMGWKINILQEKGASS